MTDQQIEEHRRLKQEAVERLRHTDLSQYRHCLGDCDPRLAQYAGAMIADPEAHNLYEHLSLLRYLSMADRYEFRQKAVRKFFKFYEFLKFSGQNGRQRYKLTPVQCYQYANIFGFWQGDKRVIREACLFVPRKFSKTTSTAALACWDLLMGDANAQCYVGANSYDQAKICFDEIRKIMLQLDPSQQYFKINRELITFKGAGRESSARCLTSKASTKDGLNASTIIMDEFSQATDASLLTVLTTSMGMRKNPLTVIITTASEQLESPFVTMMQGYKKVLRGEVMDDSVFAHIFEPDPWDDEGDPRTWHKVQPHMGITVTPDFYQSEYAKSRRDAVNRLAFRTKLLNIFTENEAASWISATLARQISKPLRLDTLKGRPEGMCAIDLSESDDFSAVSVAFYDRRNTTYLFHTAYFFPEGALTDHQNEAMYRVWAEQGHLILTEGPVIDYKTIVQYILDMNRHVTILGIGYDPWKSQEMINMLAAAGAANVIKGVGQSYVNFTAPVQSFEHGAKTGHIVINDNPINAYCFGNAILDTDHVDNMKPVKRSHYNKIDGVITMLMCLRMFMDYQQ